MSEPVHADQVARKEFSVGFRGFDQHEVRAFLARVAGELSACEERERSLRARIVDLERPAPVAELDEATIEAALGQTATRIIQAAREAAAERTPTVYRASDHARWGLRDVDSAPIGLVNATNAHDVDGGRDRLHHPRSSPPGLTGCLARANDAGR